MDLPFLGPMFDDRPEVFGVPGSVIFLAAAIVVLVIGCAWVWRLSRIEPEPRSFRATNPSRPPFATSLPGAVVISSALIVALLAVAWLLRPH